MVQLVNEFEHIVVFFDFDNLKLHCDFTNNVLEKEQSDFKIQFDKKIAKLEGSARDSYIEWQGDNHFYLFDIFPSYQWASLFNTAYSLFEKQLNYVCHLAEIKTQSNFKLKDLHGQGINRAKLYLNKSASISEPFNDALWQKIKSYAELRNIVTHALGELDLSNSKHIKVLAFSEEHPNIQIVYHNQNSDYPEIRLNYEIVIEAIEDYKSFLQVISACNLE